MLCNCALKESLNGMRPYSVVDKLVSWDLFLDGSVGSRRIVDHRRF